MSDKKAKPSDAKVYALDNGRMAHASDLTAGEMTSLRNIIDRSFVSTSTVPKLRRERLLAMGLVTMGMGGLMPTPTGRIVARTLG